MDAKGINCPQLVFEFSEFIIKMIKLGYVIYKKIIAVKVELMLKKKKYNLTKIVKNIPTGRFIRQTIKLDFSIFKF